MNKFLVAFILALSACGRSSISQVFQDAGTFDAQSVDLSADAQLFSGRIKTYGENGALLFGCCEVKEVHQYKIFLGSPCNVWVVLDGTFRFERCK